MQGGCVFGWFCFVFKVHAGLPHGCVRRGYYVPVEKVCSAGLPAGQVSQWLRQGARWSSLCLQPAFMGFPPWKTEGNSALPGFHLISSCNFSKKAHLMLGFSSAVGNVCLPGKQSLIENLGN